MLQPPNGKFAVLPANTNTLVEALATSFALTANEPLPTSAGPLALRTGAGVPQPSPSHRLRASSGQLDATLTDALPGPAFAWSTRKLPAAGETSQSKPTLNRLPQVRLLVCPAGAVQTRCDASRENVQSLPGVWSGSRNRRLLTCAAAHTGMRNEPPSRLLSRLNTAYSYRYSPLAFGPVTFTAT